MISKIFKNGNWIQLMCFWLAVSVSWYRHLLRPNRKRSKLRPGPPLVEALQVPGATPKPGRYFSVLDPNMETPGKISRNCHGFYGGSHDISRNCHGFYGGSLVHKDSNIDVLKTSPSRYLENGSFFVGFKRWIRPLSPSQAPCEVSPWKSRNTWKTPCS